MASRERKQKKPRDFEPLLVRALLRSGVASDAFLPLDGILMYQAHREKEGAQAATIPGEYSSQGGVSLPLAAQSYANHDFTKWYQYYKCSWAQWPDHTIQAQDYWNKRFDLGFAEWIDFQGKKGTVLIDKGEFKSYHNALYYRAALWLEWYCVGEKQGIERLLSTVTHIGKKTSQGFGRVARWEVQSIADDYSIWYGDKLMRGVPPGDAPGYPTGVYGIRPSYWNKANQMLLALPI